VSQLLQTFFRIARKALVLVDTHGAEPRPLSEGGCASHPQALKSFYDGLTLLV
jgi:hypothetical protein